MSGTKVPVMDGDVADFAIVVAGEGNRARAGLFLVDLTSPGVTRTSVTTVDPTRSHARLVFDGAGATNMNGAITATLPTSPSLVTLNNYPTGTYSMTAQGESSSSRKS